MQITISGKNKKLLKLIADLAQELGLSIDKSMENIQEIEPELTDEERSEKLYQLMEEMAASGGIESIQDPVKWQREVREDKKLYGRE